MTTPRAFTFCALAVLLSLPGASAFVITEGVITPSFVIDPEDPTNIDIWYHDCPPAGDQPCKTRHLTRVDLGRFLP